ncbi:MAG: HAMP domain-containing histidine kinase [Bacteroidetes bacterium]|nr:MAG: HAMP domain-containing histidine kinase [Bacteroidota bacterium]
MTVNRSILLICISLALLGVFEYLWLRKVWQEQYESLEQKTELIFRQTITSLQDSLVQRNLVQDSLPADSMLPAAFPYIGLRNHAASVANSTPVPPHPGNKANVIIRLNDSGSDDRLKEDSVRIEQVQVFIASDADAAPHPAAGMDRLLQNLPKRIRRTQTNNRYYKIELDTIEPADITSSYQQNLLDAGIPLAFQLQRVDTITVSNTPIASSGLHTQPAFTGLLLSPFYQAVFPEYHSYLIRQMAPYGAFALLLYGITTAAFVLVFRSLRQQQRLARLKNEFISNITHELKTPITTVGVALEALSDFEALRNPDKAREYLSHSKLELDRLSLLVEKVLRVSMFEEQEPSLQKEVLDLSALVRQVTSAMSLQAERAGARLELDLPDQGDLRIRGDRLHLSSLIFNLVDNALKYTQGDPVIQVALCPKDDMVRLSVRDNGIGIAPEYQARIFEKFFRVTDGNTHNVKGHGLGLSYTAQVARQHGGQIQVDSQPGKGSTFTVEFPLRQKDVT